MNDDFETRARAAARAVHAAIGTPVAETTVGPPARRGPTRALLVAAAVVAIAAIVGTTVVTRDEGAGPASDLTTFCAQLMGLVSTPVDVVNGERQSDQPSLEFLRDAPEEIRPVALEILDANQSSRSPDAATSQRFVRWWQLNCYPDAATPNGGARNERYAPVPPPSAFAMCGATNAAGSVPRPGSTSGLGSITIYGDDTAEDPYAGPMIGVVRTEEQNFYSDDHAAPIAVAGHPDAEIIDATGAWGAAIADLGQAVTWKDDHGVVTVIGRGWRRDQANELATLAASVADGVTLTGAARDGLRVVYSGSVPEIYVREASILSAPTFSISYTAADATNGANLYGSVAGPDALDAIRFFAPQLEHRDVAGTDVVGGVVGTTNGPPGYAVRIAAWRDGDVMLTLRSSGTDAMASDTAFSDFVTRTRQLDRAGWEHLIEQGAGCSWSESSSASGSDSGSGSSSESSSDSTSTTLGGEVTSTTTGRIPAAARP